MNVQRTESGNFFDMDFVESAYELDTLWEKEGNIPHKYPHLFYAEVHVKFQNQNFFEGGGCNTP